MVEVGSDFKHAGVFDNVCSDVPGAPVPVFADLAFSASEHTKRVPLIALCYGRSGDKGDVANVGIICRKRSYYPLVAATLTAPVVQSFFSHYSKGTTTRYELPGVAALNFVLTKSLGGGGLGSLNIDKQGKAYAQLLLTMMVDIPSDWSVRLARAHV